MTSNDSASLSFETRKLRPYSQPVLASTLREERIYFCVQFLDDEMLIPEMRPLVFIGHNLCPGDSSQAYFQDAASFLAGIRRNSERDADKAVFESFPGIGAILDYEHALEDLMCCSLRRKGNSAHDTFPR